MTDQVLFDSQEFVGPFDVGLIAFSPINNNNEDSSCRVFLNYQSFNPSPTACNLSAVIEAEVAPGVFEALAAQHELINSSDNAPHRQLIVSPSFNANPGVDEFVDIDGGVRISRTEGVAAKAMRLAVYKVNDCGNSPLQSFTLTARSQTYNR